MNTNQHAFNAAVLEALDSIYRAHLSFDRSAKYARSDEPMDAIASVRNSLDMAIAEARMLLLREREPDPIRDDTTRPNAASDFIRSPLLVAHDANR